MSRNRDNLQIPLSHEQYAHSPEFAELRGISGQAVADRCALLVSPAKRQLLWFIQGLSLETGGLKKLAKELLALFPERLVVPPHSWDLDGEGSGKPTREDCIRFALSGYNLRTRFDSSRPPSLEEFLVDLCINPRLQVSLASESDLDHVSRETEQERAMEEFPHLESREFKPAALFYFKDIVGALFEYKRRYEERIRAEFCMTEIARQVWKQLDEALAMRTMILIEGLEGRGKTEAVRAWCKCHLGVARFISLDGTSTKRAQFGEFARALGVTAGARARSEVQARVKEVLRTSQLMPVVDEAHFLFSRATRMQARPELLDWIDTALCNPPLPVALVTTPQFMECVARAVEHSGWNYRQFKRRCKRYWPLPAKNTQEDIEAVIRHLLPGADKATVKLVVAYEGMSKRDLSAVGDAVREARLLAEQQGASKVTFEHVKRAIHEVLLVSDVPWAEMEKRLRIKRPGRKQLYEVAVPAPEGAQEPAEVQEPETTPRLSPAGHEASRMRFRESSPALAEAEG